MPRAITAPSKKRCASTSDAVKPKPRAVTATVAASARVKSGSAGDVTKPQNRSVQVQRTQSSSSLKGSVKRATSFDSKVKAGVPAPLRKEPSFTKTKIEPFSFEARDRAQREKREQKLRQQQEDERKAHNFHAKPLPKYKPVTVHTLNRENIKVNSTGKFKLLFHFVKFLSFFYRRSSSNRGHNNRRQRTTTRLWPRQSQLSSSRRSQ